MRTLLIGCGNIGGLYDYYTDDIYTHAKAYDYFGYHVDFIEPRDEIADMITSKYGYQRKRFVEAELQKYDLISICTPTDSHATYLLEAIKAQVPVVICEKPIAYTTKELNTLVSEYQKGETRVLVNYIRRFQKSYAWLKEEISKFEEPLQSIHCNYYKGILNSASHAIDLIEFLTSFTIKNESVYELKRDYDFFKKDPTISFAGCQDGISFFFRGLKIDYQIFELDFVFESYRLSLTDSGREAWIFKRDELILCKKNMTENYMLDVVKKSEDLFSDRNCRDNFEESVSLNKTLIKIVNN